MGLLDLLQLLLGERKGASPAPIERDAERARHRAIVRDHLASSALLRSSEVEAGRVGLEGVAIARARLIAPGSGTPVIGYRLRLARCLPDGELEPILDVSEVAPFALDDGGPTLCEVRPTRCLPLLAAELPLLVEGQALLRQPFAALLDRHAVASARLRTGDRYRVTEHLLEEGETVFVFGVARREVDVTGSGALYRGALFRLVVDPPEGGLLVVADRGRDALLEALASREDFVPDW